VNDTGGNSSPYSALSAFALHPLYIRLQDVPGVSRHAGEIEGFRAEAATLERAARGRFSYPAVRAFKLGLLERIYAENAHEIRNHVPFLRWQDQNPWVIPYAVFTAMKKQTADRAWATWEHLAEPDAKSIGQWWDSHPDECMPTTWTQFLLESQLLGVSRALEAVGVSLKGDVPILMSMESADVWADRAYFDLTATAGAPPDMFSPDGQNWGFPVYDWEKLGADGNRWWKARLKQAGKFFHAFRIDHVLGFFRIWRIPRGELTGILGRFSPSLGLSAADIAALRYDQGRVRWLSVAHVTGAELASVGANAPRIAARYLSRIGAEELYTLRPEVDSQLAIQALDEPPEVKRFLMERHADRTLLADGGSLYPSWNYQGKKGFRSLGDQEKAALDGVLGRLRTESEEDWERRGRLLLSDMQGSTDMLVCAEDLGDVPRCVPCVLSALGILGLRILRWSRAYDQSAAGAPASFIPPESYPPLSVCTPSVHDTSTLRGWWLEDPADSARFFSFLGESGPAPARMDAGLLVRILERCCAAASLLCIFQVQDLLDLDEALWSPDPADDRINVPGTVTDRNWTWRMPLGVEELAGRAVLRESVRRLTAGRRARPPVAVS
jgi:4-alpha-glucanotransferase